MVTGDRQGMERTVRGKKKEIQMMVGGPGGGQGRREHGKAGSKWKSMAQKEHCLLILLYIWSPMVST